MEPGNSGGATNPIHLGLHVKNVKPSRGAGERRLTRISRAACVFPGLIARLPVGGQLRTSVSSDRLTFRTRVCASFPVAVMKNRPVRVLEDRDKDATVGLLLLGMFEGEAVDVQPGDRSRKKRGAVQILERGDDAVKMGPPDRGR